MRRTFTPRKGGFSQAGKRVATFPSGFFGEWPVVAPPFGASAERTGGVFFAGRECRNEVQRYVTPKRCRAGPGLGRSSSGATVAPLGGAPLSNPAQAG